MLWVFGLFGFAHLLYVSHLVTAADAVPPLLLPGACVLAVSFSTTLSFALWPDASTPETIGTRCASAWLGFSEFRPAVDARWALRAEPPTGP